MRIRHRSLAIVTALALAAGGGLACGEDEPGPDQTENESQNNDEQNDNQQNDDNEDDNDNQENNRDDNDNDWEPEDPPEASNEVFVSEYMTSPTEVAFDEGQWIEVYNSTEETFDLYGCQFETTANDEPVEIQEGLELGAGEFGTVANGEDPGFSPDLVLEDLELARGGGGLNLVCNDQVITYTAHDTGRFYPATEGVSIARDADLFVAEEDPAQPWLWCEGTGTYHGDDVGSPGEMPAACPGLEAASAVDIQTIRDDVADEYEEGDGQEVSFDDLILERVMVTYTRPELGDDDPAGFYIQVTPEGPALFVAVEEAENTAELPVMTGQVIDLEVEAADLVASGTVVTDYGDIGIIRRYFPPAMMVVDVTDLDDLVDDLDAYESRVVSADLVVESEPSFAGDGYEAYQVSTDGVTEAGESLTLRVPWYHVDNLGLEEGCEIRIEDVPVGRYFDNAQLGAWYLNEIELVDCDPTEPVATRVLDDSRVYVDFNRALGEEEVQEDGSDFTIEGLTVESATYEFNKVLLTTEEQTGGEEYTVEVDDGLTDFWGRSAGGSIDFTGFEPLEVAITELMARYQHGGDYDPDVGEFIEVTNLGDDDYNLEQCLLERSGESLDIGDVTVPAGEQVVFGHEAGNDGADYDVAETFDFAVLNDGATYELKCDQEVVDRVTYGGYHVELGVSLQKDSDFIATPNAGENGYVGDLWCLTPQESDYEYTVGSEDNQPKYGTPGADNTACAF